MMKPSLYLTHITYDTYIYLQGTLCLVSRIIIFRIQIEVYFKSIYVICHFDCTTNFSRITIYENIL